MCNTFKPSNPLDSILDALSDNLTDSDETFILGTHKFGIVYTEVDEYISSPTFKTQRFKFFRTEASMNDFIKDLQEDSLVQDIFSVAILNFIPSLDDSNYHNQEDY